MPTQLSIALKVLLADDHAMMREGIALMVQTEWPGSTCHFANDYASIISALDNRAFDHTSVKAYDAVVLDLRLPGMHGAESLAQLNRLAAPSPVLVCTALDDPSLLERLDTTGVFAVVKKTAGSQEFLSCLRLALDQSGALGSHRVQPTVPRPMGFFANMDFAQSDFAPKPRPCGSAMLTGRQRDILKLLHQGKSSKIIAAHMGIGIGTVKTHLHALYSVMQVGSRAEAVVKSQGWML